MAQEVTESTTTAAIPVDIHSLNNSFPQLAQPVHNVIHMQLLPQDLYVQMQQQRMDVRPACQSIKAVPNHNSCQAPKQAAGDCDATQQVLHKGCPAAANVHTTAALYSCDGCTEVSLSCPVELLLLRC